ncbi:hypothetical protein HDU98_003420 [Podochytrium sp. JEL0797]|nr:hypothetical protein HDU98_003420 [Podochytrium sp. JEL0797]
MERGFQPQQLPYQQRSYSVDGVNGSGSSSAGGGDLQRSQSHGQAPAHGQYLTPQQQQYQQYQQQMYYQQYYAQYGYAYPPQQPQYYSRSPNQYPPQPHPTEEVGVAAVGGDGGGSRLEVGRMNPYLSWSVGRVAEWVKGLGAKPETVEIVLERHVTMAELFRCSNEDLENVYLIKKLGPRLLVLDQLEKMKKIGGGWEIVETTAAAAAGESEEPVGGVFLDSPPEYTTILR